MKNYHIDHADHEQEELQLIGTKGNYNLWRVYFDVQEDVEKRITEEKTFIKYVEEEGMDGEMIMVPREVTETVVTKFFTSKYVERLMHKDNEPIPLEIIRDQVLMEITEYDTKSDVNSFKLGGQDVWLDKDTRVGLMNSTTIQKAAGQNNSTLWLGTMSITLPCDKIIQILGAIELYALECYNKTAEHKKKVGEMTTIKELFEYDYTQGYPKKLEIPYELV